MRFVALTLTFAALLPAAASQDPPAGAPLVLANAKIYPVSGPVIEKGSILVQNGRIKSVGKSISVPSDARVLDLAGSVVIPGLVDAGSGLFLPQGEGGSGGSAEHDAADSLDYFDEIAMKEASAAGVTTVAVAPPSRGVVNGLVAVVRVGAPLDASQRILRRGAALKLSLGVSGGETSSGPQRYRDYTLLKDTFEGAKKYRESMEKYRKDLEEYEKKKKEWDEKQKKPPAKKEEPKTEEPKKEEPKKEEPKKEEPKKEEPPKVAEDSAPGGDLEFQDPPKGPPPKAATPPAEPEPKKPSKPRTDPRSEILVRAMDPKNPLQVRIEAHTPDAIELALRLAEEFKLRIVLEQATEGARVAESIAKAKVSVTVGPVFRYGMARVDYLNHSPGTAAALAKAGVEVSIGSFPLAAAGHRGPGAGRFLREAAGWAASMGLTPDQALQAITLNPARQLGLAEEIGSIAENRLADLVILRGEPFDAGTTVEKTFLAGREVWSAPARETPVATARPPAAANSGTAPAGDMILLRGGRIVPVAREDLPEGAILLAGGKIHGVGPTLEAPKEATVVDLPKGSWVVPGFIDLHSHLASYFEVEETTESVTPHVKAVEAFASSHPDARAAVRSGVTLVALAPGNANLVGGRVGLLRINGERLDRMIWKDAHGLKLALGREPLRRDAEPTSRPGAVRLLRELLRDPGSELRRALVERKEPALVHALLADDIVRLAELKEATGLRAILVHGADALRAIDAIRASGMGVAFGPLTVSDTTERLETPGKLSRAGIPVAFVTDSPSAGEEYLRTMAALAVRHGLPHAEGLKALTSVPAALLGIEESFGSLEPGKQADVVVYSGDPLSLASDIELVIVEGRIVHRKPKK
jgi:imidazolonepropionase-like amidohydrolase